MKKWCSRKIPWGRWERERGDVSRCSPMLFSALSNPHVKSFPALHRKLPAEGPTVTASAGTSGNVGAVAWGGMRESASVLGRRRGLEGGVRAAGQLWKSQSPHINNALRCLPQVHMLFSLFIGHFIQPWIQRVGFKCKMWTNRMRWFANELWLMLIVADLQNVYNL